jgi:beta-glucosidase
VREIGKQSIVLLKNTHALPLKEPKSLAVIGTDAQTNPGGPNACSDRGCNNVGQGPCVLCQYFD